MLRFDDRQILERRLAELQGRDPAWAVAGNAGAKWAGGLPHTALRISDDAGEHSTGNFPVEVDSLDENFIVVQRTANLCLSHNLTGFHFYGTDICRLAQLLGRTAWVIDFHLFHKSQGKLDDEFYEARNRLIRKYARALRGGMVQTVCTRVYLSGNAFANWWFNPDPRQTQFARIYELRKQFRRTSRAQLAEEARGLFAQLGAARYAWFWFRHKLNRPFANLRRWLGKWQTIR